MASFEAWDDLVRQTVCWIGTEIAPGAFGDPLELVRRAQGSDPEQESLFALLTALEGVFPKVWFTARDVCQRAVSGHADRFASQTDRALAEALGAFVKDLTSLNPKSVGRILRFREGRIVSGLRLQSQPGRNGREYRVEAVGEAEACGFGGFGGFKSGRSETAPTDEPDSEQAESNPPNPPNPQAAVSDDAEDR